MRKLSALEEVALSILTERGSVCLGEQSKDTPAAYVLQGLVKKKRATVEMTDDGPRYHAA